MTETTVRVVDAGLTLCGLFLLFVGAVAIIVLVLA